LVLKSRQTATDAGTTDVPIRPRDPWFNPYRVPATERAWAVVREVQRDLEGHEKRERRRRPADQRTMEDTLATVVANRAGQGRGGVCGVGRSSVEPI
jgi:hypothetical protein